MLKAFLVFLRLVTFGMICGGANTVAQTWSGTSYPSSNWSMSGNWSGGTPSNNGTATVAFTGRNVSALLDADWNIGSLSLSGTYGGTAIITGSNTLIVHNGIVSTLTQEGSPEASLKVNISLPSVQTWNINRGDLPVTGMISGSGGITKTGTGTLSLGTGNTFSGGVFIEGGSILPTDDSSFGSPNGQLQINGGSILFRTDDHLDTTAINLSRPVILRTLGGTINLSRNVDLASSFSGSGTLTLTNASASGVATPSLTLSGSSAFTGGLFITNGLYDPYTPFYGNWTVQVTGTNCSLGNGPVSLTAGTTVSINSLANLGGGQKIYLPGTSALIVTNNSFDPSQIISSTSSQACLELSGSNYNRILNLAALGDGSLFLGAAYGQTVLYTADSLRPGIDSIYRLGESAGTLVIGGHDNVLTGNASLLVRGPVNLLNANDFTGGTTVAGNLGIANNGALGTGPVNFSGGTLASVNGTVTLSNSLVIASGAQFSGPLILSSPINLGGASPLLTALGGPVIFSNVISNGTLNLGGGPFILQAANSVSAVKVGALVLISSVSNLGGPTTPLIFNGGVLETTSTLTLDNPISFYSFTGNNLSGTFQVDSGTTLTLNGTISGGAITKTGSGALSFASTLSSDFNLTINSGTVFSAGDSLTQSIIGVSPGGKFSGTGQLGWLDMHGGAEVTPGGGSGSIVASILTITAFKIPNSFEFVFKQQGSPNYADLTDSGNGLLSFGPLYSGNTFAGNDISIFLSKPTVHPGNSFKGAFFYRSTSSDSSTLLSGAAFNYYALTPSGTTTFNGKTFSPLDPKKFAVQRSWVAENGGQITQFKIVAPLGTPPTLATVGIPFTYSFPTKGSPLYTVSSGALPSSVTLSPAGVLSGSSNVSGTFAFSITSTDSSGAITTEPFTLSVGLPPSQVTFRQWEDLHNFTGIPLAISHNDGVSNLLKYVCNIQPSQPMSSSDQLNLPVIATTATTQTLSFNQYGAMTGTTAQVEISSDMKTWKPVVNGINGTITTVAQSGGDSTVTVQVPVTHAPQFIRLHVTQP